MSGGARRFLNPRDGDATRAFDRGREGHLQVCDETRLLALERRPCVWYYSHRDWLA